MPGKKKHRIPPEARTAILTILKENYRIATDTMLDIAAAAVPFNKEDKALRAYWLDKCRKLMSSIRDRDGMRMVFNIPKSRSVNGRSELCAGGSLYGRAGAFCDPAPAAWGYCGAGKLHRGN